MKRRLDKWGLPKGVEPNQSMADLIKTPTLTNDQMSVDQMVFDQNTGHQSLNFFLSL